MQAQAIAHSSPDLPGVLVWQRDWLSANHILLQDKHSAVLVDSAYCGHAAQTLSLVQESLQGGRALDLLVNTHLHSDHCGGNHALQMHYPQMQTAVPHAEWDVVQNWDESRLSFQATGQTCPRFGAQLSLQAGQTQRWAERDWLLLAAPGHNAHALMAFEPLSATLITADALWQNGFGVVFEQLEESTPTANAFASTAATLDLIESLSPKWVIPGHGAPFSDVAQALARARARLEVFAAQPEKHAEYAAKVLFAFHQLECASRGADFDWPSVQQWAHAVSDLQRLYQMFFDRATPDGYDQWLFALWQKTTDKTTKKAG